MRYKCSEQFMIRTPYLPFHYWEEYLEYDGDIYEFICRSKELDLFFRQALLISSESLYYGYINKPDTAKKYRNLCNGLLKYFIRSTIRPTPFGLYAGVALGEFAKETDFIRSSQIMDIKVDNNWINEVIKNIEDDKNICKHLYLKFNRICYASGDRMKNPYTSNRGNLGQEEDAIKENSIRNTNLIKLIREKSFDFISYENLFSIVNGAYADVSKEMIHNTIFNLIQNEYLFTNLKLPAYCNNALEYLINNISDIELAKEVSGNLIEIQNLISSLKMNLDESVLILLYQKMKCVVKSKDYLEFNLGFNYINKSLDSNIKYRIERFSDTLSDLYVESDFNHNLDIFKSKFIEEYGDAVEVELLEIIDSNKFNGLSYIEKSSIDNTNERIVLINKVIKNKIELGMLMNEDVRFTKNDFTHLESSLTPSKGFDINLFVTRGNYQHNLTLGPNSGSSRHGAMFQRFSDCYDENQFKDYSNIYKTVENLSKDDYIEVELRECASQGRMNNVVNNTKNHRHYLAIGFLGNEEGEIELSDIVIGISNNNLYLKSKIKNKRLKFIKDNMLNSLLNSKIFRLLYGISQSYEDMSINGLFMFREDRIFSPRIYIEDIIVSLKKWIIDDTMVDIKNEKTFKNTFYQISDILKIDKEFYLVESDNRLMINQNRLDELYLVYESLKKNKKVEICELEPGLKSNMIIKNLEGDTFVNEMVFTLTLNENKNKFVNEKIINLKKLTSKKDLCEDGWVYFKIYGLSHRTNELLTRDLQELIAKLKNPNYFFIRYYDEDGAHIRVRLKFNAEDEAYRSLPTINAWIKACKDKAIINKVEFSEYIREINRYGGQELIEHVENIFINDSKLAISILDKFNIETEQDKIYITSISTILRSLTNNNEELFELIETDEYRGLFRDEYKQNRKEYIRLVEKCLQGECIYNESLMDQLIAFKESLNKVREILNDFENIGLTNTRKNIVLSIMHMHCNRLTGNRELEYRYLIIFRHALRDIISKDKFV